MSASIVKPVPLTAAAFAPFGDVVSPDQPGREMNAGTAVRVDWAATFDNRRAHAKPNLCAVRSVPRPMPLQLKMVERHPHSTQMFLPMRCPRWLIAVCPTKPDGSPDLDALVAFIAGPTQGINYRAGTWHHPLTVLDQPAEFSMLVWEDGTAGDCEEFHLPRPLSVEL